MREYKTLWDVFNDSINRAIPEMCDERLRLEDGTEFIVHSSQLSKHSKFFSTLFSMKAEEQSSVLIHEIDSITAERILIYLYTGYIKLKPENMLEVLIASDYLLIDPLMEKCRKFVLQNISVKNCMILLLTAWRIRRLAILNTCFRFVVLHFEKAIRQSLDIACDLPLKALKLLLKNKSINVSGERVIWSLIEEWVKKARSERMSALPELLNLISVHGMDEDLASQIVSSALFLEITNFKDDNIHLTDRNKLLKYIQLHEKVPVIDGGKHLYGERLPSEVYFVTCGFDHRDGVELFFSYDDKLDVWRKVGETSFNPLSLIRIKERIYVFDAGDRNGERDSEGVFAYDVLSDEIISIARMPLQACHISEASGEIYVLGDIDNNETGVVEKYDPISNSWCPIKPMQPMVVEETVGMKGHLYAIGTTDRNPTDMVMQVYDPIDDSWTTTSGPSIRRCLMSAVVYQDRMFLIGGLYDDGEYSRDVEVYDPVKDMWSMFPELPFDYDAPMAMVLKGRLFVYSYLEPSIVGFWDQEGGKWCCVSESSPLMKLHLYCFCPLNDTKTVREVMRKNRLPDAKWDDTPFTSIF